MRPGIDLGGTDMGCDRHPDAEPGNPVLWCDWRPGLDAPPPWGEHIDIATV